MKTDEDEAFEQIEHAQGWRKRQIANLSEINPYRSQVRDETISEVVRALDKFRGAFGDDTVDSFAIFIRGLK